MHTFWQRFFGLHKFGKWNQKKQTYKVAFLPLFYADKMIGEETYTWQERTCEVCGFVQKTKKEIE